MTAPFIGEIRPFGFNFAPRNYMFAAGQLLSIAQHTALFSILGTTYGGNGTTNFALPNLCGRVPLSQGSGPGLAPYVLGEQGGSETVTLLSTEVPSHTHAMGSINDPNSDANFSDVPVAGYSVSRYLWHTGSSAFAWTKATTGPTTLHPNTVSLVGGNQPHNNLQPFLVINWCIAINGIFPTRN